jgi:hypothetical protein
LVGDEPAKERVWFDASIPQELGSRMKRQVLLMLFYDLKK